MSDRTIGISGLVITVVSLVVAALTLPASFWTLIGTYSTWILGGVAAILAAATLSLTRSLLRYRRVRPQSVIPSVLVIRNRGDSPRQVHFAQAIRTASTVDCIGIGNNALTAEASADFYRDFLLSRRGKLRILFLDPKGQAIKDREKAEYREEGSLSLLVTHNLEDLRTFLRICHEENPRVSNCVEVKLYDFPPHLNCIIVDSRCAFVYHYGTHTRGFDAPSLIINPEAGDVLGFYKSEFESLWKQGASYQLL